MDLHNKSDNTQDFTERENDLNVTNVKSNKRKVFDSDSEVDEPSSKGTTESVKQVVPSDKENSETVQNNPAELVNPLSETGNEMFNNLTRTINEEYDTEINDEGELPAKAIFSKKPKRTAILDSDSEDEFKVKQLEIDGKQSVDVLEKNECSNENEGNDNKDLNEGHENNAAQSSRNNEEVKVKKKLKRIAIIDSDSEDDVPVAPHNKSFNDELDTPQVNNDKSVYVVSAKGKLVAENNPEVPQEDVLKKSLAALCSSESSEDENTFVTSDKELSPDTQNRAKSLKKRPTKASTDAPSGKKMTGKQALQQRQEIRSESQRMLRESRVSLPYHKPKSHSIKEFLQNRPKLSILKTNNAAPSIAMKMSVQELELVTKKLEERKRVVQEFYKSESESDEEEEQSEDPKAVDNEATGDSNKEVENKENNENTPMETSENGELVINGEDQENVDSKMGENIKETVQESNLQSGEANFEPSQMEVGVNIPENVSNTTEKIYDNENQEMNVTEEKMDTDISTSDINGQMILKENDEFKIPEPNNSDLAINKGVIFQEDVISDKAQKKPPISPAGPETSSTNPAEICIEIQDSSKQQSNIPEHCEDSVDFDFNLDGLDEDFLENLSEVPENNSAISEKISEPKEKGIEEEHLQRLLQKYEDVSNDDCIKLALAPEKTINKIDLLRQIGPIKPCLSGGPDEIIDLDEGTFKPSGVAKLMERFMKHALPKHMTKNKVQLDIINLTQGEIIKETVAMSVDPEEEPVAIVETPGIKLKKLRDELQFQMAQRRSELWQQKHHPFREIVNKKTDEKSECGADEDILDDEEEAELTDIEDEEDEEEYEEEHSKKLKTPKVKSAFIDEEAEETDDDDDDRNDQAPINDDDCDADEECSADELDEKENTLQENTVEIQNLTIKKPLRRILKGFTEDSDEEDNSQFMLNSQIEKESDRENKNASFTSLNSTDSMDDDDVPPNQPRIDKTPHKDITQSKTAIFGLLTPVQHLTGLRGFNSGSKFLVDESPVSPFLLPPDPSPLKDNNWNKDLQKKLFADSCDTFDSETNMEDIAQLCSGEFPSQIQEVARASTACSVPVVETLATQDVISMCSGSFPGITPLPKDHREKCFDNALLMKNEANIDADVFKSKGPIEQFNLNSNEEIKSLDDDDQLISEILDEEELEQFKKKFESPIAPALSNVDDCNTDMEVKGGGKLLSDSSDNEDEEPKHKKSTIKLQKRLAFSDDSESEDDTNVDDEEINLHDNYSDDEFDDNDAKTDKVINYDSEENEIELDNQEEIPRQKLRPSDFVENEAELSESDWDSADEDEKGLDTLEFEQGDAEVFDENKMRSDLEKIHMRRVLDQDNQEIKILQELLLEDGELHGTGRQRQFRWRNIDDAENEDGQKDAEIEAYLDEEESEEQWRRARHQREMFLKEKQQKQVSLGNEDFISTDSDSQVLKLGQEAVRKSLSTAALPEKPNGTTASPEVKKPLMLLNTRGSFLARTDKFLSRLAEFTKVTTTPIGGPPKTAKKFVFQTINQSTVEARVNNNKRKLENADKTPKILKKLRLSSNLTPVVKTVDRKKKLF